VDNLTGASLVPGGLRNVNDRGEVVVKSEPMSAPPKSKLMSARKNSQEERKSKINVKRVYCGETLIKKDKFTESEEEDKKRDKNKKSDKKASKKPKKEASYSLSSSPEESEDDDSVSEKKDKKE